MDYEWKCLEDGKHYMKMVECSKIFNFFASLNLDFDEVKGRIIGRQPIPPLEKFFLSSQGRKSVKCYSRKENNYALATSTTNATSQTSNIPKWTNEKNQIWCDFCNKPWHTCETYWQIHGKRTDWKSKGQRNKKPKVQPYQNNVVANTTEIPSFSRERMEQLLKLLKFNPSTTVLVGSLVQISSVFFLLLLSFHLRLG